MLAGEQFCADVPPGNARAKECLEDNRLQPGFTPACKAEVEKMMEARAADFRLDPKLRVLCDEDIQVRSCCAHMPPHASRTPLACFPACLYHACDLPGLYAWDDVTSSAGESDFFHACTGCAAGRVRL